MVTDTVNGVRLLAWREGISVAQLEVTTTIEHKVLCEALTRYRTAKAAEKMLKGQALKNADERAATYAKYDRLLVVVDALVKRATALPFTSGHTTP